MNSVQANLKDTLKYDGYSLTKTRQHVFNALADSDALSMNQLVRKLQHKMDRSSIYRTVDIFERLSIVNRLQIGWKYKIELSEAFSEHHHHAACVNCGKIVAFEEDKNLEDQIDKIAEELGFSKASHSLEIRGFCAACRN
jgi:Fur family ferric uptake transcriptional regulator